MRSNGILQAELNKNKYIIKVSFQVLRCVIIYVKTIKPIALMEFCMVDKTS